MGYGSGGWGSSPSERAQVTASSGSGGAVMADLALRLGFWFLAFCLAGLAE
jgi:hypothetical protein